MSGNTDDLRCIRTARAQVLSAYDRLVSGDTDAEAYMRSLMGSLSITMCARGMTAFARALEWSLAQEESRLIASPQVSWSVYGSLCHLFIDGKAYHCIVFGDPMKLVCQETGDEVHFARAADFETAVGTMTRRIFGLADNPAPR